jgi:hypothetical protein
MKYLRRRNFNALTQTIILATKRRLVNEMPESRREWVLPKGLAAVTFDHPHAVVCDQPVPDGMTSFAKQKLIIGRI